MFCPYCLRLVSHVLYSLFTALRQRHDYDRHVYERYLLLIPFTYGTQLFLSSLKTSTEEEEEAEEEELYDGEEYSYEYEVSNIPNYLIGTYY